jgi:selenocysteine lyase/cysteine desulfurase
VNIERLRSETPGCAETVHLNNAGAALPPAIVHDTVVTHLELERRLGGYEAEDAVADRVAAFYPTVGALIGARPTEIAYVENATRAWDMAFYAIPFAEGDRILTTTSEYASNGIAFAQVARRHGVVVEVVPDDEHGQIALDALESALGRGGVRLVAINHVPTHDGLINPVAEVGKLARAAGALYLVDACQSVGQLKVNVAEMSCDMLSATGRKFLRGPRGTGFLYVREEILNELDPPFVDLQAADWTGPGTYRLRPDAKRFETWERCTAGQLGLTAAVEYAMEIGLDNIEERVRYLADRLRTALAELPGVTVHDRGLDRSAITTFSHETVPAGDITRALAEQHIHVRTAAGTFRYDAGGAPKDRVRASVHYYNTEEELDRAVQAVRNLLP